MIRVALRKHDHFAYDVTWLDLPVFIILALAVTRKFEIVENKVNAVHISTCTLITLNINVSSLF